MVVSCISVYSNFPFINSLIFNVLISAYCYIPMVVLCNKMSKYSFQSSIDLYVANLGNIWMLQKNVAFRSLFLLSLQWAIQMFHDLKHLLLLVRFLQFWKRHMICSDKLCCISSFWIDRLSIGGVIYHSYSWNFKVSFFYRELWFF